MALGVCVHSHPNEDQNPLWVVPRASQGTPSYVKALVKSVPMSLGRGGCAMGCRVPGAGLGTAMWLDAEPGPKRRGQGGWGVFVTGISNLIFPRKKSLPQYARHARASPRLLLSQKTAPLSLHAHALALTVM